MDAIPQLVKTLHDPNSRKSAASILAWLAYEGRLAAICADLCADLNTDRDAQTKIVHSNAVVPLIAMLKNSHESAVAVEALKCLVWHGPCDFIII